MAAEAELPHTVVESMGDSPEERAGGAQPDGGRAPASPSGDTMKLMPSGAKSNGSQPFSSPPPEESTSGGKAEPWIPPSPPNNSASPAAGYPPYWSAGFAVTALVASIIIWSYCWLYIGAFWNPTSRLSNLHVYVLNCDEVPPATAVNASFAPLLPMLAPVPIADKLLNASIWNASSPISTVLGWQPASCSGAGTGGAGRCGPSEAQCVADLKEQVLQGDFGSPWALVYYPSTFTSSYLSWFSGSGLPASLPVTQYVYARGRSYSTYSYLNYVVLDSILPGLTRALTNSIAASSSAVKLVSPFLLANGVRVMEVDLAPVRNFGEHFASYIFCVLLFLGSSFVVVSSYQFKLPAEIAILERTPGPDGQPMSRGLALRRLAWALCVKGGVAAVFMFVQMIFMCSVLWALGGPSNPDQWAYNAGQAIAFGWYMSWSFIGLNAVCLHVLGVERFSSMSALLLIVMLTSSSGIMSLDLCNKFFYIGKGLPFYYGVRAFRHIFFGVYGNTYYISWLVVTAWNVVLGPICLILIVLHMHHRSVRRGVDAELALGSVALPVAMAAV